MERKLATIRKISDIQPIDGADKIEVAVVDGWKVVIQKDEYQVGDLCVYCEVDSFLPVREEYEFLRKNSYKHLPDGSEGFRLKTVKLRGQVSQGLILPLSVLSDSTRSHVRELEQTQLVGPLKNISDSPVGFDVTNELGITKYEPPIPPELSGVAKGPFPGFLSKTDEERIQNFASEYENMKEHVYYVTEKLDGSSATYYIKDGVFGVCSRNLELIESPTNSFWKFARKSDLENKMKSLGFNICLQGELVGNGIQKNPYKLNDQTVRFFNAFDIDEHKYLGFLEFSLIVFTLGLQTVPVLDTDFYLPPTIDDMLKYADGPSELNPEQKREGVVVRSLDRTISFKVISNTFLLEEE